MKKIIPILILLVVTVTSFAQQTNPTPSLSKQDYLQKSKNQKTAAWIMLGAGSVCIAIAAPGNVSFDILPILAIGGGSLIVASIPLFIASGKNKRKAMSMSFNIQQAMLPVQYGFANHNIPSLSMRMTFGKPK